MPTLSSSPSLRATCEGGTSQGLVASQKHEWLHTWPLPMSYVDLARPKALGLDEPPGYAGPSRRSPGAFQRLPARSNAWCCAWRRASASSPLADAHNVMLPHRHRAPWAPRGTPRRASWRRPSSPGCLSAPSQAVRSPRTWRDLLPLRSPSWLLGGCAIRRRRLTGFRAPYGGLRSLRVPLASLGALSPLGDVRAPGMDALSAPRQSPAGGARRKVLPPGARS